MHSKPASISDPCLGQVSISISDLQQAVPEAEHYQQQRQQFYNPQSCDAAGAEHAITGKCVLQLSVPVYEPVTGKGSAAGKHAIASRSDATSAAAAHDSLADLLGDAMPCPAASGAACGVASSKAALPTASKQHIQQQYQQTVPLYNPCTGTSSGTHGRAEVGELFVDASLHVEQLLQPQDAAAVSVVAHMPVRELLVALEAQG
jgi:hypothetical protein